MYLSTYFEQYSYAGGLVSEDSYPYVAGGGERGDCVEGTGDIVAKVADVKKK